MLEFKISDAKVIDPDDELVPAYAFTEFDDNDSYTESSDDESNCTTEILERSRENDEDSVGPDTEDEQEPSSESIDLPDDIESANTNSVNDQSAGQIFVLSDNSTGASTSESSITASGSNAEGELICKMDESAPDEPIEPLDSAATKEALLFVKIVQVVRDLLEVECLEASLKKELELLPDGGEELRRRVDKKKKELQALTDTYKNYEITSEPTGDQFNDHHFGSVCLPSAILLLMRRTIDALNTYDALQKDLESRRLEITQGWLDQAQQSEIHELNDEWKNYKITHEPTEESENTIMKTDKFEPLAANVDEELYSLIHKWEEKLNEFFKLAKLAKLMIYECQKNSDCEIN